MSNPVLAAIRHIVIAAALAVGCCPVYGQEASLGKQPINFKNESSEASVGALRVFGSLAAILAITGVALWYFKKKYPALLPKQALDARMRVVESRRVSAKLTLTLVEIDGSPILVSQSGDHVASLILPNPKSEKAKAEESQ